MYYTMRYTHSYSQQISPENLLDRQCCRLWGYHSHQKTKSLPLELKFSWRRWKTSQCTCNKVSVLIHAKEENGAEHEERLADSIVNIGQYLLICHKFYMY